MKKMIVSLLLLISFNACIKPVQPKLDFCADGHIFWGGDPAANGIGWYFSNGRTGNWKFYQVKDAELAAEFKSPADSVAVNICLVSTKDQAPCPCVEPSYYFRIKSIRKR